MVANMNTDLTAVYTEVLTMLSGATLAQIYLEAMKSGVEFLEDEPMHIKAAAQTLMFLSALLTFHTSFSNQENLDDARAIVFAAARKVTNSSAHITTPPIVAEAT